MASRPLQTPATPPPPHTHKEVMTTPAKDAKTYAAVAAMKSTPHIQDQKATGRPKGVTVTGRSTTEVGAIKPTTDRLYQGTTGSSMGETKVQKTQPQGNAKSMLCKAVTSLGTWPTFFFFFLVHYVLIRSHDLDSHDRLPVQQSHLVGNFIVPSFCMFPIVLLLW